jgi:hypothetical protein
MIYPSHFFVFIFERKEFTYFYTCELSVIEEKRLNWLLLLLLSETKAFLENMHHCRHFHLKNVTKDIHNSKFLTIHKVWSIERSYDKYTVPVYRLKQKSLYRKEKLEYPCHSLTKCTDFFRFWWRSIYSWYSFKKTFRILPWSITFDMNEDRWSWRVTKK